jgi:hypothetical protein
VAIVPGGLEPTGTVLATAADARYGFHLLNLLGSVQANSDVFDRIEVFDLGLTRFQRGLLDGVRGVDVRLVPPFVEHWRQGRTWKTWVWTHVEAEALIWLDAGITVLRPLTDPLEQIRERGYFVVSQGLPVGDSIPSDYARRFNVNDKQAAKVSIAAGILGFRRDGEFYSRVIVPTYEDALEGLSLGFSAEEAEKLNQGMDRIDDPPIRACRIFRHEQTLLGIHFYNQVKEPVVNDLYKYGGWLTPRDHPEQLLWSHRRRGDFRYLPRVQYRPRLWLFGKAWGILFYCRSWYRLRRWLFRPSTYLGKVGLGRSTSPRSS